MSADDLKNDKSIVLAAVKQEVTALKHIDYSLKKKLVQETLRSYHWALQRAKKPFNKKLLP